MLWYRSKEWKKFRLEVLEADGHRCVRCHRTDLDRAILQAHHLKYERGKKPWEYGLNDCETVCRGCHAELHDKIRPRHDWDYFGQDDRGAPEAECELCGTQIRHVFFVGHAKWGMMEVGEICCDHLTSSKIGSSEAKKRRRMERFMNKWDNNSYSHSNIVALILRESGSDLYYLTIQSTVGKKRFATPQDAKLHFFEIIQSGKLNTYLSRSKNQAANTKS